MDWIPNLRDDSGVVQIRTDGRFCTQDFTLWPQWHFPGTAHLTFVRRKPDEISLASHPYRIMWHTLAKSDFIPDEGAITRDVGKLRPELIAEFDVLRLELQDKVKDFKRLGTRTEAEYENMLHSMIGMRNAAIGIIHASQTYFMTLATMTSLQRHFLEALACYEWWTIWYPKILNSGDDTVPADTSIMGTITTQLDLAEEYLRVGIPVWLVRRPGQMSSSMKVAGQVEPRKLASELASRVPYPGVSPTYGGPPTAIRNRACQSLRMNNIGMNHGAYRPQPGDLVTTGVIAGMMFL